VVIGGVYEQAGRAWAYSTTAVTMVVIVLIGARLSRSAWRGALERQTDASMVETSTPG
jgi:hypothetical protein